MAFEYVFDFGSSTAKLYQRSPTGRLRHIASRSWCLLGDPASTVDTLHVHESISSLYNHCESAACAVGTEVFRRSPQLATAVERICGQLGIAFRVIGQFEEAELIRIACEKSQVPRDYSVANVGGGSIQIVHPRAADLTLLPFGVVDLTRRFRLDADPKRRLTRQAVSWIKAQLPKIGGSFAYTGGERTYLARVGAKLSAEGACTAVEFSRISSRLSEMEMEELKAQSPFDPDWMLGAIASNCIATALIERCACNEFLASDLNIAHGLLTEVATR